MSVFFSAIKDITEIVHANGGQVYMDGANISWTSASGSPAAGSSASRVSGSSVAGSSAAGSPASI